MAKANKVLVRLGFSDITLTEEQADKLPSYVTITDEDGKYITEAEIYKVGFEDEDGNECHEDGEYLN